MLPEFHNKPSVALRGSTWDVKHLDNFLASQWGEKLFHSKRPSENSAGLQQLPMLYSNSTIRPSAAFLAQARSQPPVQSLEKSYGNTLIHSGIPSKSYTPPLLDIDLASKKLVSLEHQRAKDEQEYLKVIPPDRRRQLFEAEKHRNKQYLKLKHEKIRETKKERVIKNEYRSGILGINLQERKDYRTASWTKTSPRDTFQQTEERKVARMQNIMAHTSPNPNIQFFNSNSDVPNEKPRGLKRVSEIPEHYHDTHNALFVPKLKGQNDDRTQRLKELWRGNRNFDIISGSYFQI